MAQHSELKAGFEQGQGGEREPQPAAPPAAPAQRSGSMQFSAPKRLVPEVRIAIDGAEVAYDFVHLRDVQLSLSTSLCDMASVTFSNPWGTVADLADLDPGRLLEVQMGYQGELTKLFRGEVVSVEPSFPHTGDPVVVVRAYDQLHRHSRGRRQRTFESVAVSDVVSQLAGEEGLRAKVDATGLQHEYLLQNNVTNLEFIHELARRHYYEVHVDEAKTLHFRKPAYDRGQAHTLIWGKGLKSFTVRKSAANVATRVKTRYWDMKQKKHVVQEHGALHGRIAGRSPNPDLAKEAFSEGEVQVSGLPCLYPKEAEGIAFHLYNERALDAVKGRGAAIGDPAIRPGLVLELEGLGGAWNGSYYVTQAVHSYSGQQGYQTEFEVRRTGT